MLGHYTAATYTGSDVQLQLIMMLKFCEGTAANVYSADGTVTVKNTDYIMFAFAYCRTP